ncbi:MAG TPA: tetratricopeptide repeat protein [Planctomycetota bacterium]|nr:tetratricopeptide repeat protein [Planctomycetota bacterium]
MKLIRHLPLLLLVSLSLAQEREGPTPPSDGKGPPNPPTGADREKMWAAADAEGWKKPCLIKWQRTWDDAVAISKETGRPILICINMDGEIASEHYAGVRYRQPEIAALYEPYVCVVASVYRHTPRDYDDEGNRIPCPRFGTVTCGEHIDLESVVFEKYCDGKRVAPRHIMVELDGSEVYDAYYRNDTASVFDTIKEGIANRPAPPAPMVRGDRPILERVQSRDIADRQAVEAAYREGTPEQKQAILAAAIKEGPDAQLELLRLALFGMNVDQSREARNALAAATNPSAVPLVADALRVPMEAADRDALLATLKRLGELSPVARYLAVVHGGLAEQSRTVDTKGWEGGGGTYQAPWYATPGLAAQIEKRAEDAAARPEDPSALLEVAEGTLALAMRAPESYSDPRTAKVLSRYLCDEALTCARDAEAKGAKGWRVDATIALASYYGGDAEDAYRRAEAAVKTIPPGDSSWASMAVVTVFAESRWKAIKAAIRDQKPWPREWLSDLHAAYTVLLNHPLGTDGQVAWHYDFLDWLGADRRSEELLKRGLARFKTSAALHARFREKMIKLRGPGGLENAYEEMLKEPDDALEQFAGAASVAAAETYRRQGDFPAAIASYRKALAHFEKSAAADPRNAEEPTALALAGLARVALQTGDHEHATEWIILSLERSPRSAGTRDGMGIAPGETATMLLETLKGGKMDALAAKLEEANRKIDPELLRPPDE